MSPKKAVRVVVYTVIHASATAFVFEWALVTGLAVSPGHVLATAFFNVLALPLLLPTVYFGPFLPNEVVGLCLGLALNSLIWGFLIVAIIEWRKRKKASK